MVCPSFLIPPYLNLPLRSTQSAGTPSKTCSQGGSPITSCSSPSVRWSDWPAALRDSSFCLSHKLGKCSAATGLPVLLCNLWQRSALDFTVLKHAVCARHFMCRSCAWYVPPKMTARICRAAGRSLGLAVPLSTTARPTRRVSAWNSKQVSQPLVPEEHPERTCVNLPSCCRMPNTPCDPASASETLKGSECIRLNSKHLSFHRAWSAPSLTGLNLQVSQPRLPRRYEGGLRSRPSSTACMTSYWLDGEMQSRRQRASGTASIDEPCNRIRPGCYYSARFPWTKGRDLICLIENEEAVGLPISSRASVRSLTTR